MAEIRYTGNGRLKLPGEKYDPIDAGTVATVTADVAERLAGRDDIERVAGDA